MSFAEILTDTSGVYERPWANIEVQDVIVDGVLNVNGANIGGGARGILQGALVAPVAVTLADTFYPANGAGGSLVAGNLSSFVGSNVAGANPGLQYTGTASIPARVDFSVTVQKDTAASEVTCGVAVNGVNSINNSNFTAEQLTTTFGQICGFATSITLAPNDIVSVVFASEDTNDINVSQFNLQVHQL